jgi:hypothetical protein
MGGEAGVVRDICRDYLITGKGATPWVLPLGERTKARRLSCRRTFKLDIEPSTLDVLFPPMRFLAILLLLSIGSVRAANPEWVYIENGKLRLGVRKDAGACIGFLAGPDGKNVLNSFDHGRFIQQSYYGDADGSMWNQTPWRYNPVQGGDWKGRPASLLEFKAEKAALYSKTRPRQWASGVDVPEMVMEQWAALHDDVLHLRIRMTYSGEQTHQPRHQEIPAVFIEPRYTTLLLHDGRELRRWKPGWPNEDVKLPDHWAAWLDDGGRGIGVYVPAAGEATCYRFGDGKSASSCSYIAPIATFALKPGLVFEHEAWFTLGTEAAIRTRIDALRKSVEKK